MLAAPKDYEFGTKIYLEWLGIWEVADRGWAIVNKWVRWHNYDRIDVWMWYGDEWLRRATNWWKRTIKWSFVSINSTVNLDYKKLPAPVLVNNYWKKYIPVKEINIFEKQLISIDQIKRLQEVLLEMNFYSWDITWDYDDIIDSVFSFQISKNIVKSEYSLWAWTYWPKTRLALKNEYNTFLVKKEKEKIELARIEEERKKEELRIKELTEKYNKLEELSFKKAEEKINFIWNPKFGEISHSVRELQVTLKKLWYFDNKDTAIYWNITKDSIVAYQLDKNIISNKNDLWAWIIWPKTSELLLEDLKNKFLKEIVEYENIDISELSLITWNEI
jgi:hypothetical protein